MRLDDVPHQQSGGTDVLTGGRVVWVVRGSVDDHEGAVVVAPEVHHRSEVPGLEGTVLGTWGERIRRKMDLLVIKMNAII